MSNENYFHVFGLEQRFDINVKALAQAYRKKQQASHPDRFAHEDAATQRQAVQNTAFNNEMYQTLKSSVQRGHYLLSRNGIEFDINNYTVNDTQMLINQLNYREQLSEIKEHKNINSLFDLQSDVTKKQRSIEQSLTELFADSAEAKAEQIKSSICELQFYEKLAYECEQVEEHLITD